MQLKITICSEKLILGTYLCLMSRKEELHWNIVITVKTLPGHVFIKVTGGLELIIGGFKPFAKILKKIFASGQ
jgi:hypothetical protein